MSTFKREAWAYVRSILAIAAIVAVIYFTLFHNYHYESTGDGMVNVFPSTGKEKILDTEFNTYGSKNYRLHAAIYTEKDQKGWFFGTKESYYNVDAIKWPNGGVSRFEVCEIINNEDAYCTDQNNTEYRVELIEPPKNQ